MAAGADGGVVVTGYRGTVVVLGLARAAGRARPGPQDVLPSSKMPYGVIDFFGTIFVLKTNNTLILPLIC